MGCVSIYSSLWLIASCCCTFEAQGKMDAQNLLVLAIHKHPEYMKACFELINDEWPQGETATMLPSRMLASRDELPTNFILVDDSKNLLGHIQLTPIPSMPESCFVESLVIHKEMRGKKLGSFLMRYIENYCKITFKMKSLYLTTKGQGYVYAKLGYEVCEPISFEAPSTIQPDSSVAAPEKCTTQVPTQLMMNNSTMNYEDILKLPKTFMVKHI